MSGSGRPQADQTRQHEPHFELYDDDDADICFVDRTFSAEMFIANIPHMRRAMYVRSSQFNWW
jgi:hypothetical protein